MMWSTGFGRKRMKQMGLSLEDRYIMRGQREHDRIYGSSVLL